MRQLARPLLILCVALLPACALLPRSVTRSGSPAGEPGGCPAAAYRELDFLVGHWTVAGAGGGPPGTSSITRALGGCALQEHYRDGEGRSLSIRDPLTGEWTQDYVDHTGLTLRLRGRLGADSLLMQDSLRVTRNGIGLRSVFSWTPDEAPYRPGRGFRQRWWFSTDSGRTMRLNFDGHYTPTESRMVPPPEGKVCLERAAYRALDQFIGTWIVTGPRGHGSGTLTIQRAAGGCLLEEDFTGRDGTRAIAMLYYDRYIERWFRVAVDQRGRVTRTEGSVADGLLLMRGSIRHAAGASAVALRWGTGGDELTQVWQDLDPARAPSTLTLRRDRRLQLP